jgi:hypothetical protein
MKTLTLSAGTFDQINTFTITDIAYSVCSLHKDKEKRGDGILWAMLHDSVLKLSQTEADIDERVRLATPDYCIENGEIVLIEGKQYRCRVLGRYSDCAVFEPVSE